MIAAPAPGGTTRIGTSGWHYASWWGPFFPPDLRKKDALAFYASRFCATELNAPFYRTPTEQAVRSWREGTPEDFRFAWKASRFITHYKRLSQRCDTSLALLGSRTALLGGKLGPILFQLPPTMAPDAGRLAAFLAMLDPDHRYSFEFRHPGWYTDEVFALLQRHDAALCLSDHAAAPAPWVVTASWVYVRGHGPGGRYEGHYPDDVLARWAGRIQAWSAEGRDAWCFFDNDVKSAAPRDATRLVDLCGRVSADVRA